MTLHSVTRMQSGVQCPSVILGIVVYSIVIFRGQFGPRGKGAVGKVPHCACVN